ncbi:MAG: AAA family ATPase [Anaerostipes sp.]|uniref:AAA family ATPase n=1 Tax=Anaerostipes sp. TaxID=1872530 RepID=UPI003994B3BF
MCKKSEKAMREIRRMIIGKDQTIRQVMTAILAGGHILIEDIPGVGKTTLALAFSRVLGLDYQRIQFTPDVMPTDIAGFSVYQKETGRFEYRKGAAMTNLLLADEMNRTSPKTQSALLEAMEEGKITVDGETRELPKPYIVIATQNPLGSIGTHSLPESQLDRFMIRISLGYPDKESEVAMLKQGSVNVTIDEIREQISVDELLAIRQEVEGIFVHDDILRYIVEIANRTRISKDLELGISPRGTIALLQMAKANAYLSNRSYMIPEDVKEVFLVTAGHRVIKSKEARIQKKTREEILKGILRAIPLPKGNRKG